MQTHTQKHASHTASPGLELFGAERVCDLFDGVTETMGIVVRWIDAPEKEADRKQTFLGF